MRILALDAAGFACSAALVEGGRVLGSRSGGNSRAATAALPGIVQALLAEHEGGFGAVAVTVGPGSFTGLRGALALAHGLALGAGVCVVGVRVAEALLHGLAALDGAAGPGPVWVALDARRPGRIFLDTGDGMLACMLDALPAPATPVRVVGDATAAVCAVSPGAVPGGLACVAPADVAGVALRRLAGEMGPCAPQPLYVEAPSARGA